MAEPAAASPQDRLRWAFAQLMSESQPRLSPEALWAMQGSKQLPPVSREMIPSFQDFTSVPGLNSFRSPPNLDFPVAKGPAPGDKREPAKAPFPGAKEVEVVGPYELPKSKKTSKDKD